VGCSLCIENLDGIETSLLKGDPVRTAPSGIEQYRWAIYDRVLVVVSVEDDETHPIVEVEAEVQLPIHHVRRDIKVPAEARSKSSGLILRRYRRVVGEEGATVTAARLYSVNEVPLTRLSISGDIV
jgi:hypothetical protein